MKPVWVVSIFLWAFLVVGSVYSDQGFPPSPGQSTTITHQAHSFDDLGEWRQLLAKGTNFIKVDVHYQLAAACASQPRVLNADARGCFLLSHDLPRTNETYYTTTDLISFFVDPANLYLFYHLEKFYLYLAFKNNRDQFPPLNITHSNDLQVEFVKLFSKQLELHNDKVTLVYDGTYYDEFNIQYTWPRTYAFSVADIDDPYSCLYSYSGYKCRFTSIINNMANPLPFVDPTLSITRMAKVDFGKFRQSPYPMVFFEPTDQRTVLYVLDTYLNSSIEHAPGFAISINIDPVQYQIYSGTRSGKAWNERLFDEAKWAHVVPLISDATSLTFLTLSLTVQDRLVYSVARGELNVTTENGTFPFGPVTLAEEVPLELSFAASPYQKLNTFPFSYGGATYVFISDFRGLSGIYEYSAPASLRFVASTTLSHKQTEGLTLISAAPATNQPGWIEVQFLQGYVSYLPNSQCSFFIQWWRLRFDPTGDEDPQLEQVDMPMCTVYSPPTSIFPVDSASLSVIPLDPNGSGVETTYCSNATHAGLLVVSSHKTIYGGVLCVDAHLSRFYLCADRDCAPGLTPKFSAPWEDAPPPTEYIPVPIDIRTGHRGLTPLDVGTFPDVSLSILPSTGEPVVLEVHADGFCYNSDWNNKRSTPRVCRSSPISSRYVLNYNYGRLNDWANHIFDQMGMISSCNGLIYHGAYDEGSLPSAFLAFDEGENMRMVEAHSGFPVGAIDYAGCSWPIPYDGAIIDGIALPPLSLMVGSWKAPQYLLKSLTAPNFTLAISPPAEITFSAQLCNMCKQKVFDWQTLYQGDYALIHYLTLKLTDFCTLGRIVIGDGTVAGCKNLILLYVPSLTVDLIRDTFNPGNCNVFSFCSGNQTNSMPDISHQMVRGPKGPSPKAPNKAPVLTVNSVKNEAGPTAETQNEEAREVEAAMRQVVKTFLYDLVGL